MTGGSGCAATQYTRLSRWVGEAATAPPALPETHLATRASGSAAPARRAGAPGFAYELEYLLRQAGRPDLAETAATLPIFGRCPCSDLACASFYTTSWLEALLDWARAGETIRLRPTRGEVSVDVANRRILSVEVLGKRDVWLSLAHLPLATQAEKRDTSGR